MKTPIRYKATAYVTCTCGATTAVRIPELEEAAELDASARIQAEEEHSWENGECPNCAAARAKDRHECNRENREEARA